MSEVEQRVRKPLMRRKPTGKFKVQPFQVEDIAYLNTLQNSANWSEMGAMKTSTAEWLLELKMKHIPNPRVLIITTKSGKGTYLESLWETLPGWDVFTVGTRKTQMVVGPRVAPWNVSLPDPLYMRPVVVLAHYHCFTNRACLPQQKKGKDGMPIVNENGTFEMTEPYNLNLLRMHWDAIIIDEAHRIKNHDAQWTVNIKKLKAEFKHIMTGTGFVNNPSEIWSLLNFLYPKAYSSYWKFREHYCMEDDRYGYRKIVGIWPDKVDEFRELRERIGVRRTMLECFPDIKEPVETVIPVSLSPTQRKMYNEIRDELSTLDQQGVPLHSANVLSALNRLRQVCVATPEVLEDYYDALKERRIVKIKLVEPSSKLDATMEVIDGLEWDEERKDQIVIFSAFRDPLELLAKRLTKKEIPYLHMKAETGDVDRYEMWHNTWPKKEHQVFLVTLGVGSESINLTSAHRAIFLDQSWSPTSNIQAIGRVYRPGQTEACQLIYTRADNTVDYRVLATNEEKKGWFQQIFGEREDDENGDSE